MPAPPDLAALFLELIHRRVTRAGGEWFERAAGETPCVRGVLLESFTAAARRLGKAALNLTREEITQLESLDVRWPVSSWGLDELGRVTLLLLATVYLTEAELEALVEECYRHGDNRERQAVLRALPLLPAPERFQPVSVDACRSHIQPVFEAIACENPYPAAHFPELNFNQMVLKALFMDVALERIVGLDRRVTPELIRMANDYVGERKAAGRSVPPDIWRLMGGERSKP